MSGKEEGGYCKNQRMEVYDKQDNVYAKTEEKEYKSELRVE